MTADDTRIDSIRAEELTREEFESRFLTEQRPVLIRGGMVGTPAWHLWTDEYLSGRVGHRRVLLSESHASVFNPNIDSEGDRMVEREEPFDEALQAVSAAGRPRFSIMQQSIPDKLPELLDDVPVPVWLPESGALARMNLWVGAAGGAAPLHFDSRHNFLGMIRGRKSFEAFAPSEAGYLYADTKGRHRHISQIDLSSPDHQRFPLFKNAVSKTGILNPGDLLFLPALWWHFIRSLDGTLSVNYWWDTPATNRARLARRLKRMLDEG